MDKRSSSGVFCTSLSCTCAIVFFFVKWSSQDCDFGSNVEVSFYRDSAGRKEYTSKWRQPTKSKNGKKYIPNWKVFAGWSSSCGKQKQTLLHREKKIASTTCDRYLIYASKRNFGVGSLWSNVRVTFYWINWRLVCSGPLVFWPVQQCGFTFQNCLGGSAVKLK